jgi:hypothetical protein
MEVLVEVAALPVVVESASATEHPGRGTLVEAVFQ